MQKVYLLLRDNQRTGPYSLEELLHLQVKTFDLVWVEGRSTGWRYPAEIESLKTYVDGPSQSESSIQPQPTPALEQKSFEPSVPVPSSIPAAKKVFVSMPAKTRPTYNYQPEEEIVKPSISETFSSIPKYAPGYQDPVSTVNTRITNEPVFQEKVQKEDYSSLFIPIKTKQPFLNSRSVALVVVLVVVGAAGYYFLRTDKPKTPSQNLVSQSVQQPDSGNSENTTETAIAEENKTTASNSKKSTTKEKLTKTVTETNNKKTNKTNPIVLPTIDQTINKEPPAPETVDVNNKKTEEIISGPSAETAPKEKKKKLGEAIKDIFKPKEKARQEEKKETVLEDPKPATNRQSTKREDGNQESKSNTESNIDLTSMVDITSNSPDNWMMGVKGLKLTLRNRSNTVIQTASVNLIYYNDNNEVLEKKLIYFSNVSAKGKATVAAPDHKYADHVEFKLATVTAKEERFVRN